MAHAELPGDRPSSSFANNAISSPVRKMCILPSDVFRDILSRVAAESLLRFRCVCKAWRNAIDDPIFIKLHFDRQLLFIRDSSNAVGQLILRGDLCNRFYSLSLESLESDYGEAVRAMLITNCPLRDYGRTATLLGSYNGVVLISYPKGSSFLWNPLTREHRWLPPVESKSKKSVGLYHSVCGLGYDCAADDYKVVKIAQVYDPRDRVLRSETLIYSLKLDSWRTIRDFQFRISRMRGGVFVKGSLHWISSTVPQKSMDNLIVGLDLSTEDYFMLPLPSGLIGPEKPSAKHLDVLGGWLILSCYYQIERLDVWLLKDYGVKYSWIKLLSIATADSIGAVETLRPIAFSKCKGQVLLQHDKKELVWFDLETKLGKKIGIRGSPCTFSGHFFVGSLVQLNSKVGSGDAMNA